MSDAITDWIKTRREMEHAATEGPWEVGDLHHIQGASQCECRPQYGPLVWEGLRDINGEIIPTHIHRREMPLGSGDTSIYSGMLPDLYVIALSTNEYVSITPEDAEFIAASRTAMPALLDAVESVTRLHEPGTMTCYSLSHTNPDVQCPECHVTCDECGEDFPCPTVQVITEALTGGESDE